MPPALHHQMGGMGKGPVAVDPVGRRGGGCYQYLTYQIDMLLYIMMIEGS